MKSYAGNVVVRLVMKELLGRLRKEEGNAACQGYLARKLAHPDMLLLDVDLALVL